MTDVALNASSGLSPHPFRAKILGEVHARPFHPVTTPLRVLHFAFLTEEHQAASAHDALLEFCHSRGVETPREGANHFRVLFGGAALRWERHAEFTTYTWEFPAADYGPFEPPSTTLATAMFGIAQPGPHLVSIDLHLMDSAGAPALEDYFEPSSLVAASVDRGGAIVAMDFKADPGGFVRILMRNLSLPAPRAGALLQRVLEIETYRMLALLGLPEAQRLTPKINGIEARLRDVTTQMTGAPSLESDHRLLAMLTGLLAELEAESAQWSFRFGATTAYEKLVQERLRVIDEKAHDMWPSMAAFLSRRMQPAIRTIQMLDARQTELARRLVRAANLLRTRVDVEIEQQNRNLLQSMNERTRMQLRLQQTVEGLSVAAISYYVVSLLGYAFEGLSDANILRIEPTLATALSVPVVFVGVALIVRGVRRRFERDDH